MTLIFSSVAFKGGVGKTTMIVNLAAACARAGLNTVLIDADMQKNSTESMGVEPGTQFYDLILGGADWSDATVDVPTEFTNVDEHQFKVVPSSLQTGILKDHKDTANNMRHLIGLLRGYADVVFIDTAPGFDEIHAGAYLVSDYVLLPTTCEPDSLEGFVSTFDLLRTVTDQHGKAADVYGILPNMFKSKWNAHLRGYDLLRINYRRSYKLLDPILESVAFVDARSRCMSIYAHTERVNIRGFGQRFDKRAAYRAVKNFDDSLALGVLDLVKKQQQVEVSA